MIKVALKRIARTLGVNFCSTDHLGVDLEVDLARFTADAPLRTIFDVGANYGQTALRYASAYPAATIFTFEPVPESFRRLQNAVQGCTRIKPFNTAFGDTRGSIAMTSTEGAGNNRVVQDRSATDSIDVPIDTIDSFTTANSIGEIDLLKIDVEGYELQVLRGAEEVFRRGQVRFVFAECVIPEDLVEPHTSFFALHQSLHQNGFCFITYYGESFRLSDGCALGNVLYAFRSKLPNKALGRVKNIV
jgi:FkbM family methyltransferase